MHAEQEKRKRSVGKDAILQEIELFESRKEMLMTISQERKRKSHNKMLMIMCFMSIFIGFFIYTYFFHYAVLHTLFLIQEHSPPFFKRFETISLQYQFIREKIINQNTNDT